MSSLIPNLDHYTDSYRIFLKKCINFEESTLTSLHQNIPSMLENLNKPATASEPFQVLGVGSGIGQFDIAILELITEHYKAKTKETASVFHRAVDPSESFLSEFRKAIEKLPETVNGAKIEFELQQMTFQDYCGDFADKFDMIHFIHSIYYVDINSALLWCYHNILRDKGAIVCVLRRRDSLTFQTLQRLVTLQQSLGQANADITASAIICSEDVIKVAEQQNWKIERHPFSYDLDVSDIFMENSTDGNLFLDFLTLQADFRNTAAKEIVMQIEDFIEKLSVMGSNGRRTMKFGNELIVIYKEY